MVLPITLPLWCRCVLQGVSVHHNITSGCGYRCDGSHLWPHQPNGQRSNRLEPFRQKGAEKHCLITWIAYRFNSECSTHLNTEPAQVTNYLKLPMCALTCSLSLFLSRNNCLYNCMLSNLCPMVLSAANDRDGFICQFLSMTLFNMPLWSLTHRCWIRSDQTSHLQCLQCECTTPFCLTVFSFCHSGRTCLEDGEVEAASVSQHDPPAGSYCKSPVIHLWICLEDTCFPLIKKPWSKRCFCMCRGS